MLPRLRGEENTEAWKIAAIGAGTMKEEDRKQLINGWRNDALEGQQRPKLSKEQSKIMLASIGIKVEECRKN